MDRTEVYLMITKILRNHKEEFGVDVTFEGDDRARPILNFGEQKYAILLFSENIEPRKSKKLLRQCQNADVTFTFSDDHPVADTTYGLSIPPYGEKTAFIKVTGANAESGKLMSVENAEKAFGPLIIHEEEDVTIHEEQE